MYSNSVPNWYQYIWHIILYSVRSNVVWGGFKIPVYPATLRRSLYSPNRNMRDVGRVPEVREWMPHSSVSPSRTRKLILDCISCPPSHGNQKRQPVPLTQGEDGHEQSMQITITAVETNRRNTGAAGSRSDTHFIYTLRTRDTIKHVMCQMLPHLLYSLEDG